MQYPFGKIIFRIVSNQIFDIVVTAGILLNTLVLCLEHEQESDSFKLVLEILNHIFIVFFAGEFVLKFAAYRLYYFKEPCINLNKLILLFLFINIINRIFQVFFY